MTLKVFIPPPGYPYTYMRQSNHQFLNSDYGFGLGISVRKERDALYFLGGHSAQFMRVLQSHKLKSDSVLYLWL